MRITGLEDEFHDPRSREIQPGRRSTSVLADCLPTLVPLHLAPVDPTLLNDIVHFRRLQSIKLSLSFSQDASGHPDALQEDLQEFRTPADMQSLVFRSLLKAIVKLSGSFPLLFHEAHAQVREIPARLKSRS